MRFITIILAALVLSACATPGPWGNYADARPGYNAQMAEDAYKQLVAVYPPAKTHLSIEQPVDDPFGIVLVQKLRKAGYGVAETKVSSFKGFRSSKAAAPVPAGQPFHYVVDRIGTAGYRVSLRVGGQALNRVYQTHGNELAPAGFWAMQE